MSIADIITVALIALAVAVVIRRLVRRRPGNSCSAQGPGCDLCDRECPLRSGDKE